MPSGIAIEGEEPRRFLLFPGGAFPRIAVILRSEKGGGDPSRSIRSQRFRRSPRVGRRRRNEDARRLQLLEVLVATVIMGVAVTGLIVGLSQSVKNASRLADYDRAAMLARTKMNDLAAGRDPPVRWRRARAPSMPNAVPAAGVRC